MTRRSWPGEPVEALAAATAEDDFAELYAPIARAEAELFASLYPEPEPPRRRPPGDPEILALKAAERARRRGRRCPVSGGRS